MINIYKEAFILDKIYLGFAGKENLRLGESLILIKKTFDILRPLVFSLNEEKLYGYLSNAYLMYSLDKIEKLNSILYLSLDRKFYILETSNYTSKRANLLAMKNSVDGEYCINLKLFSFLSERLWPAIIKAFINSLSRNDNYFYFQMHISISQIIELVECENEEDALKDFEKQLSAWLSFHKLGNIEKIEKLGENNYKFILKIIY